MIISEPEREEDRSAMSEVVEIILAHLIKRDCIGTHFSAVALRLSCGEDLLIPLSMVIQAVIDKHHFLSKGAVSSPVACLTS
ncbi:hypothetical protein TSMEX_003262 [Taenia solium]|eukprot:TsM_000811000 transcript=TsM_000811000 gene=TsM_000811000